MNGAWRTISVALHADAGQYVATLGGASAVTNEFGKTTDGVTARSGASWTGFGKVVATGIGVGLVALTLFIGASIRAATEFETRMAAVQAVSGATGAEIDSLRTKALQLGADTSFSAGQAASAMEALVKAGVSVPDVLNGAADATVNLAAAGEVDLVKAAEISANAINQFGMDAGELPHVADLVAGAANTSAIGVEDFGLSLSQTGSVADLVGASFDDVTVAITAMGNAGIVGSDAGTSLKSFLQRLTPTTTEARKEMEKLGIITADGANQFFDAEGNLKSFDQVAQILQDSLAGLTNEQKLATLQTLYGSDAIRAAAVFVDEGAEGWDNLAESIGNVSAADVAEDRLNSLGGSIEKFKGSVETLLISSGGTFTKLLKPIIDGATDFVNILAADPSAFFESLRQKLKPLLPFWHDLVDTGENIVDILAAIWEAGQPTAELFAKLGGAAIIGGLTGLADAIEAVTGFLADNEDAIGLVVRALVLLGGVKAFTILTEHAEVFAMKLYDLAGAWDKSKIVQNLGLIGSGTKDVLANLATVPAATEVMASGASAGFSKIGAGLSGIVAGISPVVVAIAAVAAAWYALDKQGERVAKNARKRADDFLVSISPTANKTSRMQEISNRIADIEAEYGDALSGFSVEAGLEYLDMGDLFTNNDVLEARNEVNMLNEELEALGGDGTQEVINQHMTELFDILSGKGMDISEMNDWIEKLDLDPSVMSVEDMATAINEAKDAAANGTPLTDDLSESYDTLASSTANATEKVDAWKEAMDRALGIKKNVVDARVDFEAGLDDLKTTLTEYGWATGSFDPTTEAGRATISAASSSVDDAIAYVEAITDEQGIEAGAFALAAVREQIIQSMESTGMARDEAEDWVNQLGLTPDLVETQVAVSDPDGAQGKLDDLITAADSLDGRQILLGIQAFMSIKDAAEDVFDAANPFNRWGGIYSFATGGTTPAHVARGTRYKWAEPETGGEAFLPRFGDLARSESIMGQVAGWYGGTYLPHGTPLPQHQPRPLVTQYQGIGPAEVREILAGLDRPNVHVEARTDADPQQLADHINRVSLF